MRVTPKEQEKVVQVQVGKQGVTDETIKHIDELIADKKSVHVRFLKSALSNGTRQELAEYINAKLGKKGKLIGNTISFPNKKR